MSSSQRRFMSWPVHGGQGGKRLSESCLLIMWLVYLLDVHVQSSDWERSKTTAQTWCGNRPWHRRDAPSSITAWTFRNVTSAHTHLCFHHTALYFQRSDLKLLRSFLMESLRFLLYNNANAPTWVTHASLARIGSWMSWRTGLKNCGTRSRPTLIWHDSSDTLSRSAKRRKVGWLSAAELRSLWRESRWYIHHLYAHRHSDDTFWLYSIHPSIPKHYWFS